MHLEPAWACPDALMDAKSCAGAFVAGRVIRSGYEGAFGISGADRLLTTRLALMLVLLLIPGISAFEMEAYVKAPNAESNDGFGRMALSGDTLAVGAGGENSCSTSVSGTAATDNGCPEAGAVYVYTRSGTTWSLQAYVKAPNAERRDHFGTSVALSGDTLAVGAYLEDSCTTSVSGTAATDNGCSSAGAAYVYTRSGTTWSFQAYVKAPNAEASDVFGSVVALSGDTLAVAALFEGSCSTSVSATTATEKDCSSRGVAGGVYGAAGAVYVYTRSGTTWSFQAYVKAPNAEFDDYFGQSVALSGDTLAVGANGEDSCSRSVSSTAATDNGCTIAGAVYVYTRSGTTWSFQAYVKAPNAGSGDYFGILVALSGDTLAVGARDEASCSTSAWGTTATDNGCSNAGAVYVYTRSGTTWSFQAYVKAPNAEADDGFCSSVTLSDDTLAVGRTKRTAARRACRAPPPPTMTAPSRAQSTCTRGQARRGASRRTSRRPMRRPTTGLAAPWRSRASRLPWGQ